MQPGNYTDGTAQQAVFSQPGMMAYWHGTLYVADVARVRAVNTSTGAVTTLAGSSSNAGYNPGLNPTFRFLTGIAVDGNGTLYVADRCGINNPFASVIATINLSASSVTAFTFAGNANCPASPVLSTEDNDGAINNWPTQNNPYPNQHTNASFSAISSLAIDSSTGNLFVAQSDNAIRMISNGVVRVIAGWANQAGGGPSQDGLGAGASFGYAGSITVVNSHTLYLTDGVNGNFAIRWLHY